MSDIFLMAVGLMLVVEGLMPLLMPNALRNTFIRMIELKDGQLRFIGLFSVISGLLLVYLFSK